MNLKLTCFILILSFELGFSQELAIQTGHAAPINKIRFSFSGQSLASASDDKTAILWDLKTHLQSLTFSGHSKQVNDVVFSPDDKLIATASDDATVKVWDATTGSLLKNITFMAPVKALVFVDNATIYCASDFIYRLNWNTLSKSTMGGKSKKLYNTIAYHPVKNLLAYGGRYDHVSIYSLSQSNVVNVVKVQANEVTMKEEELLVAGKTGVIKIFDFRNNKVRLVTNTVSVFHDFYSANSIASNYLLGGDKTGMLSVFDYSTGSKKIDIRPVNGALRSISVSPNEKSIAVAGTDERIVILSDQNFEMTNSLKGNSERITNISFSKTGQSLFIGYDNGNMKVWDLKPGGKIVHNHFPLTERQQKFRWRNPIVKSPYYWDSDKLLINQDLVKSFSKHPDTLREKKNQLLQWSLADNQLSLVEKTNKEIIASNRTAYSSYNPTFQHPAVRNQKTLLKYVVPYLGLRLFTFTTDVGNLFRYLRIADAAAFGYSKYPKTSKISKVNIENSKNSSSGFTINRDMSNVSKIMDRDVKLRTLTPDGTKMLSVINSNGYKKSNRVVITDLNSGSTLVNKEFPYSISQAVISPAGKYYVVATDNGVIFNSVDGYTSWESPGQFPIAFDLTETRIVFVDYFLLRGKNVNGSNIFQIKTNHSSEITSISWNPLSDYIASSSLDGTIKFWDIKKHAELVTLVAVGREDFIYVIPSGYYYASKGALSDLGFRTANRIFSFDQFDVTFNRPDKVIPKLPGADPSLIKLYKEAYTKRIKVLAIDTTKHSTYDQLPEVSIRGLEKIMQTDKPEISFTVESFDRTAKLKELHVLIDGVPLFGKSGVAIANINSGTKWTKDITARLTPGINKIQAYVINENGVSSYKESISVTFNAKSVKPDLYLVAVGSSRFADNSRDLNFAAKDANDFESLFKTLGDYSKIYTQKMLDQEVTRENISRLSEFLKPAKEEDVVLFFYAGHGMLDAELNYYLSTYNINFSDPSTSGIAYESLELLLEQCKSRKKVLFIDACHSGEIDKAEATLTTSKNTTDGKIKFRNVGNTSVIATNKMGLNNLFEVTKSLFADLRRNNGIIVISSAGGAEYAMEGTDWNNGIFTYCLLNGVKNMKADGNSDQQISIAELRRYLFAEVPLLTDGKQSPTYRTENLSINFRIK